MDSTPAAPLRMTREERKVVFASSLGTVFEWYDFYLFGSLLSVISARFFGAYPEWSTLFALLAFAAGFLVRPFGALVFGGLGDRAGRKYTFLITIVLMGSSTALVGLLPTADTIGFAAPVLLIALRLIQGLALGGEYGGAATYVAEHAPRGRRGFYTSFIQTTATLGLFLSLLVIEGVRWSIGAEAFSSWGWRIPFLVSIVLLVISVWIRLQLQESPTYRRMKEAGQGSKSPVREAFGRWRNLKWALIALFGMAMGQGVVWYTGQFYALFFLGNVLKVDPLTTNLLVGWSLLLGAPFFIVFGWLSDKVGRKPIILGGCLLAAFTYNALFDRMSRIANPDLYRAQHSIQAVVQAEPATCSVQFNPVGTIRYTSPCDVARGALSRASVPYEQREGQGLAGAAVLTVGGTTIIAAPDQVTRLPGQIAEALAAAGYPAANNPSVVRMRHPFDWHGRVVALGAILLVLVLYVTMVYGPIAAALVELFPTRIRYTGMSLPYHIGNGWFGGLLPATAFAIAAHTGDPLAGLIYPAIIAQATVLVGLLLLPETKGRDLEAEDLEAT